MDVYLGIDIGSVTTKFALLDDNNQLITSVYLRTQGKPVGMIQEGLRQIRDGLPENAVISGVGATGNARNLASVVVGADVVKNEITSQAVAALQYVPDVQTIIEIGGQDSKIIILRQGRVTDFSMNNVCAAHIGSFLDYQALSLGVHIENFGMLALQSNNPARIAGQCNVFVESDMITRQQTGRTVEDILYGLCQALVHNYLHNVVSGKRILPPIVFQGGVAFNQGIVRALKENLGTNVIVPPHHEVAGAMGVALQAREEIASEGNETKFNGFGIIDAKYHTFAFECKACYKLCEIVRLSLDGKGLAYWGGRCDLW